jgi:cobalt-zinc-cadmium efflux system membrane fusion protein
MSRWRNGWLGSLVIVSGGVLLSAWLMHQEPEGTGGGEHRDHAGSEHEQASGPHGGRLLEQGDFSLELLIHERGVPPRFRIYAYADGAPIPAEQFTVALALTRLEGTDRHAFTPRGTFQQSDKVVREPHSFDVEVIAEYRGEEHRWHYESHEGRTSIPADVARSSGVQTERTGPVTLNETVRLTGTVHADPSRLAAVAPRYRGVVRSVKADVGDRVGAGQVLAVVESNDSLRRFDLPAPIAGLVLSRDVQVGQVVGEQPLFQLVDISRVWVQLDVFGRDLARISTGQQVGIRTMDGSERSGKIDWLSPLVTHGSQSIRARVELENEDGALRPGQFVIADVVVDRHDVNLAVRREALQTFRDFDVVYARFGHTYEVRMLELGHGDARFVEVVSGIESGQEYVTRNSYLIKADIEKSGASHDH